MSYSTLIKPKFLQYIATHASTSTRISPSSSVEARGLPLSGAPPNSLSHSQPKTEGQTAAKPEGTSEKKTADKATQTDLEEEEHDGEKSALLQVPGSGTTHSSAASFKSTKSASGLSLLSLKEKAKSISGSILSTFDSVSTDDSALGKGASTPSSKSRPNDSYTNRVAKMKYTGIAP